MVNKGSQAGVWSATIAEPSAAPQTQSEGLASFTAGEYPEEPAKLEAKYLNEPQSLGVKTSQCLGSTNEPTSEPGFLCFYRGVGQPQEATDKDAKFTSFRTANGEEFPAVAGTALAIGTAEQDLARHGLAVVFKTNQWEATGGAVLTESAHLQAKGSWSVTAN